MLVSVSGWSLPNSVPSVPVPEAASLLPARTYPETQQPRLKRPINLFRQLFTRPWLHAADVDLLTVRIGRLSATAVPSLGDLG
jgi:hypothetical protein